MSNSRKRAHGEGSIYQLPSGKWRAQVTAGGKRISHTARTKKEAAGWLKRTASQVEQGLTWEGTRTTLGEVIDGWLEIKASRLRPATQEQYSRMMRLYIRPGLGDLYLKDLSTAQVQAFYKRLEAQGVGRRTIEVVHTVLHGCLKYVRRLELITQNWAALVEVPRPERREMQIWSESQVAQFLAGIPETESLLYRLAFATGMRRGELIGLQWQDVNWGNETLTVQRQIYEPQGGGWHFQEPKTKRGRRIIRLGPGLLEVLRKQFNEKLPQARALAGDRWQEYDLIFPTSVGTPRNGYEVSKTFKRLAEESGLPSIRFHDIRHTAASLMLLHGEPPVRVAYILGQSIVVLLDVYAHYIPDDQADVSALMDTITTPVAVDLSPIAPELHTNKK